jgi:WD40 repeat protein
MQFPTSRRVRTMHSTSSPGVKGRALPQIHSIMAEEDEHMLNLTLLPDDNEDMDPTLLLPNEERGMGMDAQGSKDEIVRLRAQLHKEHSARLELEETCDMLALANQDLRDQVARLTGKLRIYTALADPPLPPPPPGVMANGLLVESPHVPVAAASQLPALTRAPTSHISCRVEQACGTSNPLSVTFVYPYDELPNATAESSVGSVAASMVAVGSVDKCVRLFSMKGALVGQWQLDAPVLWISAHGHMLCAGCMDGCSVLIDCSAQAGCVQSHGSTASLNASAADAEPSTLQHLRKQGKYVVCTCFSPGGLFLATLSYDRTIHLYSRSSGEISSVWTFQTTYSFPTTPESMVFLPAPAPQPVTDSEDVGVASSTMGGWRLVVAARNELHLQSLSLYAPYERSNFVSLNEQIWDTHLGMQALLLSTSPDLQTLAVSTDKSIVFLLDVSYSATVPGTDLAHAADKVRSLRSKRLKVLGGHSCGEYAKPALAWGVGGAHLYSNSEGETGALVWETDTASISHGGSWNPASAKGSPTAHLVGHTGIVRALAAHRTEDITVTVSYDHSVVLWSCKK